MDSDFIIINYRTGEITVKKALKIFNSASAVILILFGAFYTVASSAYFNTANAPLMIIGIPSIIFAAGLLRSQLKNENGEIRDVDGEKIFLEPSKWSPALALIVFGIHIFMLPNIIIATDAPFYINVFCYCTTALSAVLTVTALVRQKLLGKAEKLKKRVIAIIIIALIAIAASAGKYALFANTQQTIDAAENALEYTKNLSPTELSDELPAAETIRNEITTAVGETVYYCLEKGTEQKTDASGRTYTDLIYYVWTTTDISVSQYKYRLYDDGTATFAFATSIDGVSAYDFSNSKYFTWEYK